MFSWNRLLCFREDWGWRVLFLSLPSHGRSPFTWITQEDHLEAVDLLERRSRRNLSLVDCMSFVVMKQYGVTTALVYDLDFQAEGFNAWTR